MERGGGEELKKEQGAGGCGEAVGGRGGGGETVGPSEISRDEEHVSNPWGSAGKPPEMGAVELPLQPGPGRDPLEQR